MSSTTQEIDISDATTIFELCERVGCTFTKNENINNNGGTHCCMMCKNSEKHGPLCSSKKNRKSQLEPVSEPVSADPV
jgi:hypothetical protein